MVWKGHLLQQVHKLRALLVSTQGYQNQHAQYQAHHHNLLFIIKHVDTAYMFQPPKYVQHVPVREKKAATRLSSLA